MLYYTFSRLQILFHIDRAGEVDGGGAFVLLLELVVLAGEYCVEGDADDGGDSKAGEADYTDLDAAGVVDADGKHEDESGNDNIARVGEVDLIFNNVSHTDCGDHTVEDEGHAADGCGGHCRDESCKLGAEGDDYCDAGRDADNARVIDLGERKHTGVFAVGSVGRAAEESRKGGCKAVAEKSAMEAGVGHVVLADSGGYCADVADMLNHGG